MSTVPAVRFAGVSKRYRVGEDFLRYQTLRETLVRRFSRATRNLAGRSGGMPTAPPRAGWLWALEDVTLDVADGESIGIIGRNGAGKSTLLKVLSRITAPTAGRVESRGRVGSLLEVGTGFHPELTGHDNIFLNGAILGMSRRAILQRYDEIVAFSGIEAALHTPVKRYSTGMYLRLAFAVAAHLDSEILIVDEVLAVGDTEFQKRCLRKMGELAGVGRTVFLVSHNLAAVRTLCSSACLLDEGRLIHHGAVEDTIRHYLRRLGQGDLAEATVHFPHDASRSPRMLTATVLCDGAPSTALPMGGTLALDVEFAAEQPMAAPRLGLVIHTSAGEPVLCTNNRFIPSPEYEGGAHAGHIRCDLGVVPLMPGTYLVSLYLGDQLGDSHIVEGAVAMQVTERDLWGQGVLPPTNVSPLWWPARFTLERSEPAPWPQP
jgi:lipopolysaccharide transport system ATP-binding protein